MAYWKGYAVALVSLLTGASMVHFIYRPDLVSLETCQLRLLRQMLLADYLIYYSRPCRRYVSHQQGLKTLKKLTVEIKPVNNVFVLRLI